MNLRSNSRKEAELLEKAPMSIGRVAFGCAVDNYGERIFAIGGTLPKQQATDVCEEYQIEQNTW